MIKHLILLITIFLLTACASGPKYKEATKKGGYGYSEQAITNDRYRVNFKAKGENQATAYDYAMLRAAELTLQNSYEWFEVVDRQSDTLRNRDSGGVSVGAGASRGRTCGLLGCSAYPRTSAGLGVGINLGGSPSVVEAFLEIKMGRGERPDNPQAYSAQEVKDKLSTLVGEAP